VNNPYVDEPNASSSCSLLVTGPWRSLSLKLSDTRVYEPQIRTNTMSPMSLQQAIRGDIGLFIRTFRGNVARCLPNCPSVAEWRAGFAVSMGENTALLSPNLLLLHYFQAQSCVIQKSMSLTYDPSSAQRQELWASGR